jgi:formate dehydrogenase subunit gamma
VTAGNSPAEPPDLERRVRSVAAAHRGEGGALLPILHDLYAELGYIDPGCIPVLADELNLSRADVHGVISFYRDFKTAPSGRTTVRICRAEACQAVGAEALAEHAHRVLGIAFGGTTADGAVTLEQTFCFGNCALGPTVQIGPALHGRVDAERFDVLLAAERA